MRSVVVIALILAFSAPTMAVIVNCTTSQLDGTVERCTACNAGTFLSPNLTVCGTCGTFCSSNTCTSQSTVTTPFTLASGVALSPSPQTTTFVCGAAAGVVTCAAGSALVNGVCASCGVGCAQCSGTGFACTACSTGYSLINGRCIQCPLNCASCTSSGQCSNCQGGYDLVRYDDGVFRCRPGDQDIFGTSLLLLLLIIFVCIIPLVILCYFLGRGTPSQSAYNTAPYVPLTQQVPTTTFVQQPLQTTTTQVQRTNVPATIAHGNVVVDTYGRPLPGPAF